jgi:hypothetical protein
MNIRMPNCLRLEAKFTVGGYVCEISFTDGALTAFWSTRVPPRLFRKEQRQYLAGRDALIAESSKQLNGAVLVVEI